MNEAETKEIDSLKFTKVSSIRTSESVTQIAASLVSISTKLEAIQKKGRNSSQNYDYAKFEDYIESTKPVLSEEGLTTISTVGTPHRLEARQSRSGGYQYPVEVKVTLRLLHKSGEWMEIDAYGEGQDSGDKGIYKAITGGRKYAVACLLNLSTTDDPEKDEDNDKEKSKLNNKNSYQKNTYNKNYKNTNSSNYAEKNQFDSDISKIIDQINTCETLEKLSELFVNLRKKYKSDPKMITEIVIAKDRRKTELGVSK